ncbi:MAG: M20 family metallopeptidase [bacterium]
MANAKFEGKLISLYRKLHQNPELGWQEHGTARIIAGHLKSLGIKTKTRVGKTGVLGLTSTKGSKCIALRADMDALPIKEQTRLSYASKNKGIMHACGHDANMSCVLGAASLLAKDKLDGSVKFIFQPNEETSNGAHTMIKAGALKNPRVDAIVGVHVHSGIPAGKIGIRYGQMMAAVDEFTITIFGEGGHGALPHKGVDAVLTASNVISQLQSIVSRQIDPLSPAVISIGTIKGGTRFNVIADKVTMSGTVRTVNEKMHKRIPYLMKRTIEGITRSMGAKYKLDYKGIGASLVNDDKINDLIKEVAIEELGSKNIVTVNRPSMGGEDFSAYLERVPGAFIYIGVGNKKKNISYPWHHPKFMIDESALSTGARLLAGVARKYLSR